MNLGVLFLGTAAWAPSAERGAPATMILRGGEHLLVDCGEGTQRQMMRSTAGLRRLTTILITHCHPDHVMGLPGLLATYSDMRHEAMTIAGPAGTSDLMAGFHRYHGDLAFPLQVLELDPGQALAREGYRIIAVATEHRVPSVGWLLVEDDRRGHLDAERARATGVAEGPELGRLARGEDVVLPSGHQVGAATVVGPRERGRRILVTGDTRPCSAVEEASRGADLLVHEATFLDRDADLARESGHTTAAGAAALAARANVALLALIHASHRYGPEEVLREARRHNPATVVPDDLDLVEIPLPEHGRPHVVAKAGRGGA